MVKTKRGRTKRKLEDLIKDVCDIDEVFQQKNKDDDGNQVSNYQRASFEAFSLHARIQGRCGYRVRKYNDNCKKKDKENQKIDPKNIPDDKLHLFIKDNEKTEKNNSHDDWKLVKNIKENIEQIYKWKNTTVPSINSDNYLKVISPILKLRNSEEEQELFVEEENQEEQVEQPIENTGVIVEQQVETQLETEENNEEEVDDEDQVQLPSEDAVDPVLEHLETQENNEETVIDAELPVPEHQDDDQLETLPNNEQVDDSFHSDTIDNSISINDSDKYQVYNDRIDPIWYLYDVKSKNYFIEPDTLSFVLASYPSMIVLHAALDIEEYLKKDLMLPPATLGQMINTLKNHEHYIVNNTRRLRKSQFNIDHHRNLILIYKELLHFVNYRNTMFHYNNVIEKNKIISQFGDLAHMLDHGWKYF